MGAAAPFAMLAPVALAHRSRLVRDNLGSLCGHILIAFLLPYAPDHNPVEYLWA